MCRTSFHVCYYGSPTLSVTHRRTYPLNPSPVLSTPSPKQPAPDKKQTTVSETQGYMCSTTSCFSQGTSWMMMQSPSILTSQNPSLSLSRSQLQRRLQHRSLAPRGSTDRNSGWCITGRRVSRLSQLNNRSSHARWKAHYSPVSCDSLLWCSFVNVVNCGKGEGTHVPAQCAGKFFFRGTGLPTAVRKNQPLVPRSNLGGKVCARTDPWFRGQTLPVPGHGGYLLSLWDAWASWAAKCCGTFFSNVYGHTGALWQWRAVEKGRVCAVRQTGKDNSRGAVASHVVKIRCTIQLPPIGQSSIL